MGYAMATSACVFCKRIFSYNPMKVPSFRADANGLPDPTASREPVCKSCMDAWNARRVANGLHELRIHPEAYLPCREEELGSDDRGIDMEEIIQ